MDDNAMFNTNEAMPEMVKFEVSKKQLIGEPWKTKTGELLQKILIGDGWMINRPQNKLYETEDGKITFSMAKMKRDGTMNEISLQRSIATGEIDENAKKIYQQEKMTVKVEELPSVMEYYAQKFKYQKEEEAGFISLTVHEKQFSEIRTDTRNGKEYVAIRVGEDGSAFWYDKERLTPVSGQEGCYKTSLQLRDTDGNAWLYKIQKADKSIEKVPAREVRDLCNEARENVVQQNEEQQREMEQKDVQPLTEKKTSKRKSR